MNPKQKSFLDDLAALFRQYNIDYVNAEGGVIYVVSHGRSLSFESFENDSAGGLYTAVTFTVDVRPDDHSAIEYSGDENFDD